MKSRIIATKAAEKKFKGLDLVLPASASAILLLMFGMVALLAIPFVALSGILALLCRNRIESKEADATEVRQTAASLAYIKEEVAAGRDTFNAISVAALASPEGVVKDLLSGISRRIAAGEDFGTAANAEAESIKIREIREAFSNMANEYSISGRLEEAARSSVIALDGALNGLRSSKKSSLNRYTVLSVVAAAVLPGMATFAFVGYSLLYYSATVLLLFCMFMLSVMPSFYSVINVKLASLYGY
ncbi:hypothetical protein M1397_03810 [Candidatus Marsarchaeota archaeon]|jgi:hypothetical protein|nr:hypothetical protein [Candidatus Marsarchaeota archaeon]